MEIIVVSKQVQGKCSAKKKNPIKTKKGISSDSLCDLGRSRTRNLLIRSQTL